MQAGRNDRAYLRFSHFLAPGLPGAKAMTLSSFLFLVPDLIFWPEKETVSQKKLLTLHAIIPKQVICHSFLTV